MCAVFGIIVDKIIASNQAEKYLHAMEAMQKKLWRRGPDDSQQKTFALANSKLFLGHNRLAILGNSQTAKQPMKSPDGRFTVSFNGQIYNFVQLAKELGMANFSGLQNSDTEVLVAALQSWGLAAFEKFDGMFACAIIDHTKKQLILVRDHFGIKPMFWSYNQSEKTLVFASELKAVKASNLIKVKLDASSLITFLRWGTVHAPKTMLQNIFTLEPGQILIFDLATHSITFSALPFQFKENISFAPADLETTFLNNLQQTTTANVELGLFLSGGMDSSAIACGLHKLGFKNLKTFTLGFDSTKGAVNETMFAKNLAAQLGFKNFCWTLNAKVLRNYFVEFTAALDSPTLDGFNTFLVSKLAALHVKVVLGGLGADELFFGYPEMRQFAWGLKQSWLKQKMLAPFLNLVTTLPFGQNILSRLNINFLPGLFKSKSLLEAVLTSRELFTAVELQELGFSQPANIPEAIKNFSMLNNLRLTELQAYTTPILLADSDALSMHSSLELRVPFLNQAFVKTNFLLPENVLLQQGSLKPALATAVKNFVPEEILLRKKTGFVLPMGQWILDGLGEQLDQLSQSSIFSKKNSLKIIRNLSDNPWGWRKAWALLIVTEWLKNLQKENS